MKFNGYDELIEYLFSYQDTKYRDFNQKIVNTTSPIIGIRSPIIKSIAKKIDQNEITSFIALLHNKYYEETLLEGLVISRIKDNQLFNEYLDKFIYKINNWAVCDMCISNMKQLRKDEKYFKLAKKYIKSNQEFITRVGYIIMMDHFMDDKHIDEILNILNKEKPSNYYYVNMAKAWLISVCYVKYRDKSLSFIKNNELDEFTHNKAIQKIIESYRVSTEDKTYLKTLKK